MKWKVLAMTLVLCAGCGESEYQKRMRYWDSQYEVRAENLRQERLAEEKKVFLEGSRAADSGVDPQANPFLGVNEDHARIWLNGWIEQVKHNQSEGE